MSEEITKQEGIVKKTGNPYLLPGAIVLAGICVALAIYLPKSAPQQQTTTQTGPTEIEEDYLSVTEKDHVFGSRDADVFLIEYSDYRCGYCGLFHDTIKQVLDEYDGRVAWVYRHTPYQPGGKEAAVASECIAEQLGEDAFWSYTEAALSNQRLISVEWSKNKAVELGADETAYEECVSSGKFDQLIAKNILGAQSLGGGGTPYNVLLTRENGIVKFSGAQPLESVRIFVNRALNSLDNK